MKYKQGVANTSAVTYNSLSFSVLSLHIRIVVILNGNSHQILLSEMSVPWIEVLLEKLLPKILGRLEKENPLKGDAKLPLYRTSALWHRQFRYDFYTLMAMYN